MIPAKAITTRGYSIEKAALTAAQIAALEKELTAKPQLPPNFAEMVTSFPLYLSSPTRYYIPNAWGKRMYGEAVEMRSHGAPLREELTFTGTLRSHQVEALEAYKKSGNNGIICLPCGYGKTFTAIAAALELRRSFMIVVHKEFLADQWLSELKTNVPGIKVGRIQGEKCDITEVDCSIAMIQTLCSRHYPAGTFANFGLAIFDEVHHLGAEHFSQALQKVNVPAMLGLTATPKRADGLTKVFTYHLGEIVYNITKRPKDDTVRVEVLRFTSADPAYTTIPTNFRGEIIRAHLINAIAEFRPRTVALVDVVIEELKKHAERRVLILSDRREHLITITELFHERGYKRTGYYVGGMKQADLDTSAKQQIILGTFAMASEGMNIPVLNMVVLATPKSSIEQSVGRILRTKKEDRIVEPIILDILDTAFVECLGQYARRKKFFKECGYTIHFVGDPETNEIVESEEKKGVPLFVED